MKLVFKIFSYFRLSETSRFLFPVSRKRVAVEDFAVVAAEAVVVGAPRVVGVYHVVIAFGEITPLLGVKRFDEFGVVIGKYSS